MGSYVRYYQRFPPSLEDFPTVTRADAVAALEEAKEALLAASDAHTP